MEKRKTYSEKLRLNYLSRWQASQLSAPKFCKEVGISFHTFKYWQKKYKITKSTNNKTDTFVPIKVQESLNPEYAFTEAIKVIYPNGIEICCPLKIDEAQLKVILNFGSYV